MVILEFSEFSKRFETTSYCWCSDGGISRGVLPNRVLWFESVRYNFVIPRLSHVNKASRACQHAEIILVTIEIDDTRYSLLTASLKKGSLAVR